MTTHREVGSDFEIVARAFLSDSSASRVPWDRPSVSYVETGRQALGAAAHVLWQRGYRKIYVPGYLCDSMVEPFLMGGWEVALLPSSSSLETPPEAVAALRNTVLLNAPYFGRRNAPDLTDALARARQRGVVVIRDETHSLFEAPSPAADIRVASLRKVLPLFDGGYVIGLPAAEIALKPARTQAAQARQAAMRAKSDALAAGGTNRNHLELFAASEDLLTSAVSPRRISSASEELLRRLDLAKLGARRRSNAIALVEALSPRGTISVINPPTDGITPSHLVIEVPDAMALRQWLAARGFYCPIHWPRPQLLPTDTEWPTTFLSLPVDHRYDGADMRRLASAVVQGLSALSFPEPLRSL